MLSNFFLKKIGGGEANLILVCSPPTNHPSTAVTYCCEQFIVDSHRAPGVTNNNNNNTSIIIPNGRLRRAFRRITAKQCGAAAAPLHRAQQRLACQSTAAAVRQTRARDRHGTITGCTAAAAAGPTSS